jgi:pre-rRNA-processing protein IPI1
MTNSNKHKNERKKDFQKEKLKVGKARPKNTNATDTSFAARCMYEDGVYGK